MELEKTAEHELLNVMTRFIQQAESRPNIEFEARFSTFYDNVYTAGVPAVPSSIKPNGYRFIPLIDMSKFYKALEWFQNKLGDPQVIETIEFMYPDNIRQVNPVNPPGGPHYLKKTRMGAPHDIFEYGVRLGLSQEQPVVRPQSFSLPPNLKRHKVRKSIIDRFVRYDFTHVVTNKFNGEPEKNGYEIEIEWLPKRGGTLDELWRMVNQMLCLLQDSPFLVSVSDRHNALLEYSNLLGFQKKPYFVGAQPETFQMTHLTTIGSQPFAVTDKLDGHRCLLFVRNNGKVHLLDRKMQVRATGLVLPEFSGSLFDTEVLTPTCMIFVFDTIFFKKSDLRTRNEYPLSARLTLANEFVNSCVARGYRNVQMKMFIWNLADTHRLLPQNISDGYERDGLVFTPAHEPYPNRSKWSNLLKWKPADWNSIDFLVKFEGNAIRLHVGTKDNTTEPFEHQSDIVTIEPGIQLYDGVIAECTIRNNNWHVLRIRTDKMKPNFSQIAKSVWHSIQSPVTEQELIKWCQSTGLATSPATTVSRDSKKSPTGKLPTGKLSTGEMSKEKGKITSGAFQNMRNAHNKIKSHLITNAVSTFSSNKKMAGLKVLDLGCGRGGDIFKWEAENAVTEYVGVDVNAGFIDEARQRAEKLRRLKTQFHTADLSCEYPQICSSPGTFDIVSFQFCFHYFMKSRTTFDHVLEVVRFHLKQNGVMILTTLDGAAVHRMCSQMGQTDKCVSYIEDDIGFTVTPNYNRRLDLQVLAQQVFGLGLEVQLHGEESLILQKYSQEEYLVFPDTLVLELTTKGFVLKETDTFTPTPNLSLIERMYSELNRWYLFQFVGHNTTDSNHTQKLSLDSSILDRMRIEISVESSLSDLFCLHSDQNLCHWLTLFTGQTLSNDDDLVSIVLKCNIVIGQWTPDWKECSYITPDYVSDDTKTFYIDAQRRLIVWKEPNTGNNIATFTAPQSLVSKYKTGDGSVGNGSGHASIDESSVSGLVCDSTHRTEFMGRSLGRGKGAWTVKELRDFAKKRQVSVPSNAKKQDIVTMLSKLSIE